MDAEIVTIIVALIGLASTYFGAKYGAQYQKGKSTLTTTANLLNVVVDAAKDDKITEAEFQAIVMATEQVIKPAKPVAVVA
jgi:hypothetical protein